MPYVYRGPEKEHELFFAGVLMRIFSHTTGIRLQKIEMKTGNLTGMSGVRRKKEV
jgi:hypothetical protein